MLILHAGSSHQNEEFDSVVFLITVNNTWRDCMATVKTPNMAPDVPRNETSNILVGDCDSGPLVFTVTQSFGKYKEYIYVVESSNWYHSYNNYGYYNYNYAMNQMRLMCITCSMLIFYRRKPTTYIHWFGVLFLCDWRRFPTNMSHPVGSQL